VRSLSQNVFLPSPAEELSLHSASLNLANCEMITKWMHSSSFLNRFTIYVLQGVELRNKLVDDFATFSASVHLRVCSRSEDVITWSHGAGSIR